MMRRREFIYTLAVATLSPLAAAEFEPGRGVFGEKRYIEYLPGDLPLVISAPHGGKDTPAKMPTREKGKVQIDANTQVLARAVAEQIRVHTGHHPHLIICRLHRSKLDCNREIVEAAAGDPVAEKAWSEYHGFIQRAHAAAIAQAGKVFYIDLHGQSHPNHRIELGYLHKRKTYERSDQELNAPAIVAESSFRLVAATAKLSYADLLRGPHSLGALLEARGFPCTPSPSQPAPPEPFFEGGYSVRRYVVPEKPIAGFQLETNLAGIRDTAANRAKFTTAFVDVLLKFLTERFDMKLAAR